MTGQATWPRSARSQPARFYSGPRRARSGSLTETPQLATKGKPKPSAADFCLPHRKPPGVLALRPDLRSVSARRREALDRDKESPRRRRAGLSRPTGGLRRASSCAAASRLKRSCGRHGRSAAKGAVSASGERLGSLLRPDRVDRDRRAACRSARPPVVAPRQVKEAASGVARPRWRRPGAANDPYAGNARVAVPVPWASGSRSAAPAHGWACRFT